MVGGISTETFSRKGLTKEMEFKLGERWDISKNEDRRAGKRDYIQP